MPGLRKKQLQIGCKISMTFNAPLLGSGMCIRQLRPKKHTHVNTDAMLLASWGAWLNDYRMCSAVAGALSVIAIYEQVAGHQCRPTSPCALRMLTAVGTHSLTCSTSSHALPTLQRASIATALSFVAIITALSFVDPGLDNIYRNPAASLLDPNTSASWLATTSTTGHWHPDRGDREIRRPKRMCWGHDTSMRPDTCFADADSHSYEHM